MISAVPASLASAFSSCFGGFAIRPDAAHVAAGLAEGAPGARYALATSGAASRPPAKVPQSEHRPGVAWQRSRGLVQESEELSPLP